MIKRNFYVIFMVAALFLFNNFYSCVRKSDFQTGQHPKVFEKKITKYVGRKYLLYIPKDYFESKGKWPLMLFLHGGGERGDDLELVKKHGPPKIVKDKEDFPFILISPQHPENTMWSDDFLIALVDDIISRYRVDEDRVYVTGLSGGGTETYRLAIGYPYKFAAIAPICGRGFPDAACRLKHLPIWVFHGAKDKIRSIEYSIEMVEALKKCGGNVKFTVYPEAGHDAWTETYNNPELYEWFLSHRRVESD